MKWLALQEQTPAASATRKFFGIVDRKPLQNRFFNRWVSAVSVRELLFSCAMSRAESAAAPFYIQFIAGAFGVVGIFHLPQTGRSGKIAQMASWSVRCPVSASRPLCSGKIYFSAHRSPRTAQEFQLKDDVFVLHGLPLGLPQRMKGAGRKNKNIPHAGRVEHSSHLHQPRTSA